MTETPKSAARLLIEAATIAGFRAADGWPVELNPRQLAALMAGGWEEPHKREYGVWRRMIAHAIKAGNLAPRRQSRPPVETACDAGDLSEYARFSKAVFPSLDGLGRVRLVYYEKREQPDTLHIDRDQCAAWLRATREAPSEHVRAWLGDAWQEQAPTVGAGKTTPIEKRTRAALIQELESDCPTIARDLQDAARNGLAAAAKLPEGRGWDKRAALEWARERGKLKSTRKEVSTTPWPPCR